jgi:hypothetical protein
MARMAERGHAYPAVVATGIAFMLFLGAAYAFAGSGLVPRLPLLRMGLIAIATVYLLRAFALLPAFILRPDLIDAFAWWSSAIVLVFGLVHAIGIWRGWNSL